MYCSIYSQKFIENPNNYSNKKNNSIKNKISFKEKKNNLIDNLKEKVNFKKFNFNEIQNLSNNKKDFIETLVPLIVFQNQKIIIEREKLFEIKDYLINNKTLIKKDRLYLEYLAKKYLVKSNNRHKIDIINDLSLSVDVIPISIVIAQAANESGWGTSRFAKEYNALFGQYTYNEDEGIIPNEREEGEKHLIKNFSSIDQSIESYFMNINTHHAYKDFRFLRKQLKENYKIVDVEQLVKKLNHYAQDKNYTKIIISIINSNNLKEFDEKNYSFIKS